VNRIRILAAVLLVLAAFLGASLPAQGPSPLPQPRPRLVVVIVVDQMRADYIERFHGRWSGGLRRLVDQGAWFANAAYPYAATGTCPGHATVSTGVFPATHGIIGNTWWDRQAAAVVTCTRDSAARRVGLNGAETAAGEFTGR